MTSPRLASPADAITEAPSAARPMKGTTPTAQRSRGSWVPMLEVSVLLLILLATSLFLYALLGAVCCGR